MDFSYRNKFRVRTIGIKNTITAGQTGTVEYNIPNSCWLSAVKLIVKNVNENDVVQFKIVDVNFLYAGILYPATPLEAGIPGTEGLSWSQVQPNGVVLDQFGKDYMISTDREDQGKEEPGYWAKLEPGMFVIIEYNSYGSSDVLVKVNLYTHIEKNG